MLTLVQISLFVVSIVKKVVGFEGRTENSNSKCRKREVIGDGAANSTSPSVCNFET